MKRNSVRKNFIYNVVYQLLIHFLPLVTIPYVSRVLGADGIGVYSYTYSIVYYFMIFAILGLANYGNRTIAKVRDNREELSKTFKEIRIMQLFSSIAMVVLYVAYLMVFNVEDKTIAIAQILYLLSCVFDISWFFFGLEKFKLSITWNTTIKLIALALIFIFVRTPGDVWTYTVILGGSTLLSQLVLWLYVKKYADRVKVSIAGVKRHIVPNLRLFLTVVGVTFFKVMDKTMIGLLSDMSEVGYYENAEKISQAPVVIVMALGTVMLPRMSNMYGKGDHSGAKEMIKKSIKVAMFLSFAMVFGLIAISQDFSVVFFGPGFVKSGTLMQILAVTIVFLAWGNVIRTQYLVPREYDREYATSAFLGAGVNLIINLALIPSMAAIGACVGTVFAEVAVAAYQTFVVRKKLPIKEYIFSSVQFLWKALLMFIIIMMVPIVGGDWNPATRVTVQIIVGVITYGVLNYKYVTEELLSKSLFHKND